VLLFGPSESGKTFTLKGKTGMERGILPRAVEDIFNIVKNSEDREEEFEVFKNDLMTYGIDEYPERDYPSYQKDLYKTNINNIVPERMFMKMSVY
jgi:hypothetical protein